MKNKFYAKVISINHITVGLSINKKYEILEDNSIGRTNYITIINDSNVQYVYNKFRFRIYKYDCIKDKFKYILEKY